MPLDHAADGDDGLTATAGLESRRLDHRIDRFLLGGVDEAAGIDDDEVGLAQLRSVFGRVIGQLRQVSLAIDRILVAAERDYANFHGAIGAVRAVVHRRLNGNSRI